MPPAAQMLRLVRAIFRAVASSTGPGIDGCLADLPISTFRELPELAFATAPVVFAAIRAALCSVFLKLASTPKDMPFWSRPFFALKKPGFEWLRFRSRLPIGASGNRK